MEDGATSTNSKRAAVSNSERAANANYCRSSKMSEHYKKVAKAFQRQTVINKSSWKGFDLEKVLDGYALCSINSLAMRNFVLRNFAFAIQRQSGDKWSHHNLSARRPTMDKKLPPLSSLKPFDLHHFTFTFFLRNSLTPFDLHHFTFTFFLRNSLHHFTFTYFLRNSLQSGFWIGPTYPNPSPIYGKCVGKFSSI